MQNSVKSRNKNNKEVPLVLMLGPALSNRGGVASVEKTYLSVWDHERYRIKMIPTFVNGPKLKKFFFTAKAIFAVIVSYVKDQPKITHIHFSVRASIYRKSIFVILAKLFRCQVILHCHAPDFDIYFSQRRRPIQRYIRWILNFADLFLTVAQYWEEYFINLPLNVQICTLYNPVEIPDTIPVKRNIPVILFLGRLEKRKGIYDLLEAIPRILSADPNTEFWLAGDGEVAAVEEIVKNKPWGKKVRVLGWVEDKSKEEVFSSATMLVLPSYSEGLPISVLEAMSRGLPVVSTSVGGIPELVQHNENGLLVTPGDIDALAKAIIHLLEQPEQASEMGRIAHHTIVSRFSAKPLIQELYNLYDNLIMN